MRSFLFCLFFFLPSSSAHHPPGPLYAGDDAADVQDSGAECAHSRLLPVGALPRWHQVQRRPGHPARPLSHLLLSLYHSIQGGWSLCVIFKLLNLFFDLATGSPLPSPPTAEHLQLLHHSDGAAAVCRALLHAAVPSPGGGGPFPAAGGVSRPGVGV